MLNRRLTAVSPLALLTLAACGGGSSNGSSSSSASLNEIFAGNVVKGPLANALVFLDFNGNGTWDVGTDSAQVRTDASGAFSITSVVPSGVMPTIVALSDGSAFDSSSGQYLDEGVTLVAPNNSSVITPMTTLVSKGDLQASDVADALGLTGVDLLNFNPYTSTDTALALKVEIAAHQVLNLVETMAAAGEASGLTAAAAVEKSVEAFKGVIVAAKAAGVAINMTDTSTTSASKDVNIAAMQANLSTEILNSDESELKSGITAGAAKAKLDAASATMKEGISTVNSLVESIPDGTLLSTDTSDFFSVGNTLKDQVAKVVSDGTGTVAVANAAVAQNIGANKSATKVELKSGSDAVTEVAESLAAGSVVGNLSADDTGTLQYSVVESSGTDYSLFRIIEVAGVFKLALEADVSLNHETAPSLVVKVQVTDSLGKSFIQEFTIAVTNVEEVPVFDSTSFQVDEGKELSVNLDVQDPEGKAVTLAMNQASDLFEIVGNVLSSNRIITQEDVDGGALVISVSATDVGTGQAVIQAVTITPVNVNDSPLITKSSLEDATEGRSYTQIITATDEDNDDVTLTLLEGPAWLTLNNGTLSGTVPTDDTLIDEAVTVKIQASDGVGDPVVKNYTLNFININDVPQLLAIAGATVVETANDVGVIAAVSADNLTGSLMFNDIDDAIENLTLSLNDSTVSESDGTLVSIGDYGRLTFDATNNSYVYSPDAAKIEVLHNETQSDTFTFSITDAGGLSAQREFVVTIEGANDYPRLVVAADQNFVTLGNGQSETVIGTVAMLDGSSNSAVVLAAASASNDNSKFEILSGNRLKLKVGETTDFATQDKYYVELQSQDYDNADPPVLIDASVSAATVFEISVTGTDAAPRIQSISTDYTSPLKIDDQLNFTVELSEQAAADGAATLTLTNGATVTLSVGASASQILTGTYNVVAGDADSAALEVRSIAVGTVADTSGNALTSQSSFDDLGTIFLDANAPTAKVLGTDQVPHTYDTNTGVLSLQGLALGTLINAGMGTRDVKDIVDWTKLSWDVDANDTDAMAFSKSDIANAIVSADGAAINVTLVSDDIEAGQDRLLALEGFGGTSDTGGTVDAIDVAAGFLKDSAGNRSSATSTATSSVAFVDTTAPVLSAIQVSGAFTSGQATGRVAGDIFIAGDTLTYTATVIDSNDLIAAENMSVTLTLSNNKILQLIRADELGSTKTFSADYLIAEGDTDSSDLTVKSYAVANISDISGNLGDNTTPLMDQTLVGMAKTVVVVDATVPTAQLLGTDLEPHSYDVATGVLVLEGVSLGTIIAAGDATKNVIDIVDWTKLSWDADGNDTDAMAFAKSDVTDAIVSDDGSRINITLSSVGQDRLLALEGFGGTSDTGGTVDAIDVAAGFLKDSAGNRSSATSTATSSVSIADIDAPTISAIDVSGSFTSAQATGRSSGDAFIAGDTLTYSVTMVDDSDLAAAENMTVTLTLSNNKTVQLVRANELGGTKTFSASYVIAEGDTDSADLTVRSYAVANISDTSGNNANNTPVLPALTLSGDASSSVIVDANAPTAQLLGTEVEPHTFNAITGVLVLRGDSIGTIAAAGDTDVKEIVDWTKLSWDVDGANSAGITFAKADVETAVVDGTGTIITVTLSTVGLNRLLAVDGFGGTVATGGTLDALDVAVGFLRDPAGNLSTATSTAASEVKVNDVTASVLASIELATDVTAGVVDDLSVFSFEAIFTDNAATDDGELADDAELVLTLNNGAEVTLTKSAVVGEKMYLIGDYTVQVGDDTVVGGTLVDLAVAAVDFSSVRDLSGNLASDSYVASAISIGTTKIDTVDPILANVIYDIGDSELVFLFEDLLDTASANAMITALDAHANLSGGAISGTNNTTITFAAASAYALNEGETVDFSYADVAGNSVDESDFSVGSVIQ